MFCLRFLGIALIASSPAALATDLSVTVRSAGQSLVTATPGQLISYEVVLELSDAANEGLGGFTFDLVYDGGNLTPLTAPASGPALAFISPNGFSNPAGFGGTVVNGDLVQLGGAQNTIQNFFAPRPSGNVVTGVAQPGNELVIGTGTVQAPAEGGSFSVSVQDLWANVIRQGETGFPFYAVDAAGAGTITDLVIEVPVTLSADIDTISLAAGGVQTMTLDAGPANAGRLYFLAGSLTGALPGFTVGTTLVPLVNDFYTGYTFTYANQGPMFNNLGVLNGLGQATATLALAPGVDPIFAGIVVRHAYVLPAPFVDFASNVVSATLVP